MKHDYADVNGIRIHYVTEGVGDKLLRNIYLKICASS